MSITHVSGLSRLVALALALAGAAASAQSAPDSPDASGAQQPAVAGDTTAADDPAGNEGKQIFGWVEWVRVQGTDWLLKAKLDTGAKNSSLDARDIEEFRREGERYIRFTVVDRDSDQHVTLERELERVVRIKEHAGQYQRRPVVELTFCLGDLLRTVEVNLVDRSQFIYPLLLGRSALDGRAVVDAQLTFTRRPMCSGVEGT